MSYYDPSTGYFRPLPDRHHCDRWYWRGRGCDGLTRSQRLAAIIVPSICFPLLCLVVLFAIWRIRVLRARVNAVEGRQLVTEGAVGALEEQHKKIYHKHRRHSHSRYPYDTPYPYSYPPLGIHPHYYRPQHHRYHGGGCDRKYIGYY
ncbi:hypothetical protein NBRC10512_004535 [Rhodotorula toruloides]|uniref:RHTO0S14e04170g1_1 n=2 Tax=Rhodotorula toruloides TaxID=5286 RepID=A0A061BHV7_RHOTO|nr:uncharacterized protein RHTO_05070 [Rhodotorula toruloides NP11]EMS24890.1 hypothetical protein RHTO_05070 [Rhodotorula toruloides NP11]KAJ8297328.1 hypothetical protein OF846_000549 [Rhodotorula toruloides]CDR47485.1 RHTO0S14e04170g1_1 [Rhodotorula toruloides]